MTPKEELVIKFNHIILVQGFSKFSMVDLAKMADISRAKLYIYFKNKDEIVNSVVDRHLEFLKKYPIPATAKDENLLSTILNSLLLLGSTTELFENELREKYPQLYRNFKSGYEAYFTNLEAYYKDAQENKLIIDDVTPDFIFFQNKISIRGILDSVRTNQLSLDKGEQYLSEYFTYQIHSLLLNKTSIIPDDVKKFSQVIINEYYDTYANIKH